MPAARPWNAASRASSATCGAPRAADEAHRARPRAVAAHGLLVGRDHAGIEREAQIAVGVHAQERLLAAARDEEARALAARRRHHADGDGLGAFQPPLAPELLELGLQQRRQPVRRHGDLLRL